MKIANIISGHYRTGDSCYSWNKKNFLDIYNPDVFISTYDNESISEVSYHAIHSQEDFKRYPKKQTDIGNILDKYKPKILDIVEDKTEEDEVVKTSTSWSNFTQMKRMLEGIIRAYNLLDDSYNMIIRTRFDIAIRYLDFKDYDGRLHFHTSDGGFSDLVFFGSQENFKKLIDGVQNFLDTSENRYIRNSENILKAVCDEHNIPYVLMDDKVVDCLLVKKSVVRLGNGGLEYFSTFPEFLDM